MGETTGKVNIQLQYTSKNHVAEKNVEVSGLSDS
jgi:hypothetical protein